MNKRIKQRMDRLQGELDNLDIPALNLDLLIDVVCAELDLNPLEMIDEMIEDPDSPQIPTILRALILEGIESGTQLPQIKRALEIGNEMLELE